MEDKMKPGKAPKQVTAGLRKSISVSGNNNDPGRPPASKAKGGGSNRGRSGVEGRK